MQRDAVVVSDTEETEQEDDGGERANGSGRQRDFDWISILDEGYLYGCLY